MSNVLLALLSFVVPGAGQIVKGKVSKALILASGSSAGYFVLNAAVALSNDRYLALVVFVVLLDTAIRLYSAVDAARLNKAGDAKGSAGKWSRLALVAGLAAATLGPGREFPAGRLHAFSIASGSTMLSPELEAGTALLGVPYQYWEQEPVKGDFVIIEQKTTGPFSKSPFILQVHGVAGEKCPASVCTRSGTFAGAGDGYLIPKGHYVVGARNPQNFQTLVSEKEITAKAGYVYWPLNKMRKL
ncbi:hypothetical protein [Oleidesulfovibrio alaskensis]